MATLVARYVLFFVSLRFLKITVIDDLVSKVNSFEFEESDGSLVIDAISWQGSSSLSLALTVGCGDDAVEVWRVACSMELAHVLRSPGHRTLTLAFDHPVLWPHTMPCQQLYVTSTPNDPAAAFGSLAQAHLDLVGSWFPISRFM